MLRPLLPSISIVEFYNSREIKLFSTNLLQLMNATANRNAIKQDAEVIRNTINTGHNSHTE